MDRLNTVLRKKVQELDDANRRISEYEYELRKNDTVKNEMEDYRIKYGEYGKKIVEYENKVAILSQ